MARGRRQQPAATSVFMARKKVNLQWIANDLTRRATFKKRRGGLMKKVSELAILCDVKACAVVYGPEERHPEVWPPSPVDARRVLTHFKSLPQMEQCKKMMNQGDFLRQRIEKVQGQIHKHKRDNREEETRLLMYQGLVGRSLSDVGVEDATSLAWLVEMRAQEVRKRIERLRAQQLAASQQAALIARDQKMPMEPAIEPLKWQTWLMECMSPTPNENVAFGGGVEAMQPLFMDHNNPAAWMDPYYPLK